MRKMKVRTEESMESELLNRLAAKGCGIEAALAETYMGAESLMVRILGKVPASTALSRVETALAAADVKGVFEASHELKGLYATTALTPLYEKCCEIVEISRAGSLEGIAPKLEVLKGMHAEFCAVIAG